MFSFCFVYTQLIFQFYKQDFAMLPRQTLKSNPPVSISQMKFMPFLFNNNPYHEWFLVYSYNSGELGHFLFEIIRNRNVGILT